MRIYLGGGGSVQDEAALWGEFLSPGLRVVYWPFALEPSAHASAREWLVESLGGMGWGDVDVSMWSSLAGRTAAELASADLLFVGGGNTFALLDEVVRHDFLPVVREYLRGGGAMYGGSAGAILAGADISIAEGVDANDVGLSRTGGLDLLGGLVVRPHYEPGQDAELAAWSAANGRTVLAIPERGGVAVVDGVARTVGPEDVHLIGAAGVERRAVGESWQLAPGEEILAYTRANAASWNEIAPARRVPPAESYLRGESTLEDFEPGLLPDVAGQRMLHLACANGADSISWAFLGASVTGVDISEVAIRAATQLAADTGADARFVVSDLYELPGELRDFDVIYASAGVVCWLPDLDRWARTIAERLRPGGTFVLNEHHPIWEVLGVRDDDRLAVTVDYFGRGEPTKQTYDQAKRPSGSTAETAFSAFVWPVSDVVMSLVRAGLRIEEFFEAPLPPMYAGLNDGAERIPALYVIKAVRPLR